MGHTHPNRVTISHLPGAILMPAKTDFPAAFAELRAIMQPYEPDMLIVTDTADNYYPPQTITT